MNAPVTGGVAFRIHQGDFVALVIACLQTGFSVQGTVRVVYDDGSLEEFTISPDSLTVGQTNVAAANKRAARNGWVVAVSVTQIGGSPSPGAIYAQVCILIGDAQDVQAVNLRSIVAQGYVSGFQALQLGVFHPMSFSATWMFVGSVAEDATGGTHTTSLSISPGAGQELELVAGSIQVGNTATAQTPNVQVLDDGANFLYPVYNENNVSFTTANLIHGFTEVSQTAAIQATGIGNLTPGRVIVSGAAVIKLSVTTAAVSVTHTYAFVCRLRGSALPTATLADTVGTPVLTTTTNKVI